MRRVWKDYFPAVDAIVFLIDVWDRPRFGESMIELESLLADEQLANCPILILGNVLFMILGESIFSVLRTTYLMCTSTVIVDAYVKLRNLASCGNIILVAPLFSWI